jgi:serine/threonine-protein kinase
VTSDHSEGSAAAGPQGLVIQGIEIREALGKGGMGVVYKGWDPELERFAAVKMISEEALEDEDFVTRFRREARAASLVNHPNVARVYFAGKHEGRGYYAMEYVEGKTLAELLDEHGQISVASCVRHLRQACEGLRAAHEAGVVHRDIKPSNLMLDQDGVLKIVDFGLARRIVGDARVTRAGAFVGSPAYISPEQARGGEVDHRSDIYSLGATFFHLLAGRPPFLGDTPLATLAQHCTAPLPALAERCPGIPPHLCSVIERMLAKDPADRYQSYDELFDDLALVQTGQTQKTTPVGARSSSRRLVLVAAAVLVLVAVAIAVAVAVL